MTTKAKRKEMTIEMTVVNSTKTRGMNGDNHAVNLQAMPEPGQVGPGYATGQLTVQVEDSEHWTPGEKVTLTIG